MNVIYNILKVVFISLFLISCSKMPWCWGEDKNEGLIIESYSMKDFPMCVERYVQENETLIISSEEELLKIIDSTCTSMPQAGYNETPPDIDFEKYSLIGQWATGQCETKFLREVEKDEDNKKITFTIQVRECGTCKSERYDANLVTIPKIPVDYQVEFDIDN